MRFRVSKGVILACAVLAAASFEMGGTTAEAADRAERCAALTGATVPPSALALPTGGATVTLAQLVQTLDSSAGPRGEQCRVLGRIEPDAEAAKTGTPPIQFQLNLPDDWNGKAVQFGGGGYNGQVVTGTTSISFTFSSSPLYAGYVTYGADSGHVGLSTTGDFGTNEGALRNFAYEYLKKSHDAAVALIGNYYGRAPERSYFAGASTGGREGMTVVERYPADYDGIIANAPAIYFTGMRLIGIRIGQADYARKGGFLSGDALDLVRRAVLERCDGLDGANDGIVSDVEACRAKRPEILAALRCPASGETGCLSDSQIGTVKAIGDDLVLPWPLAYGVTTYPGYNILQGADFRRGLGMGSDPQAAEPPTSGANGYLFAQGDAYLRFFVANDPALKGLDVDLDHPGKLEARLAALSEIIGAMNPDTSAFQARGGKLIVLQGLADDAVSPNGTIGYYRGQVARYGQPATDRFFRLYTVPGFGHGRGAFIPSWEALAALDRWVTMGEAPGTLQARDVNPETAGRTRPLCVFPGYPRYKGTGSVDDAASFECATAP